MQQPSEFDFLEHIVSLPVATITEQEFKKFLPLFAYRKDSKDLLPLGDWIKFIGSGFGEVYVYERRDREGNYINFLFKVPPVFKSTDRLSKLDTNSVNLSDVITQAKLKSDVHENLGEAHLKKHLLDKLEPDDSVSLSIAMRWNNIFQRYGMPLIPLGVKESGGSKEEKPKRRYEEF